MKNATKCVRISEETHRCIRIWAAQRSMKISDAMELLLHRGGLTPPSPNLLEILNEESVKNQNQQTGDAPICLDGVDLGDFPEQEQEHPDTKRLRILANRMSRMWGCREEAGYVS